MTLLKIDREFVVGLDSEDSVANRHVVKAIVSLAEGMGQKTVAEGVETEATFQILRELGVDYAQGYLFARPASADDVFGRLVAHKSPAGHELVGPIASQDGFRLKH